MWKFPQGGRFRRGAYYRQGVRRCHFGHWFQRMIDDCNLKSPSSPIVYQMTRRLLRMGVLYQILLFKRRFYIDPDVTLAENRLKSHDVIIAKRVANEIVNYKEY